MLSRTTPLRGGFFLAFLCQSLVQRCKAALGLIFARLRTIPSGFQLHFLLCVSTFCYRGRVV